MDMRDMGVSAKSPSADKVRLLVDEEDPVYSYAEDAVNVRPVGTGAFVAKVIVFVSFVDIICTLLFFGIGLAYGERDHSAAITGQAMDALVDTVASVLVVWRFWDVEKTDVASKERRASIFIAFLIIMLGMVTGGMAISKLVRQDVPEHTDEMEKLAIASVVVFSLLFFVKLWLVIKVKHSTALKEDTFTTFIGVLLSLGVLLSSVLVDKDPNVWAIDPSLGIIMMLAMFGVGIYALWRHPGFTTRAFWMSQPAQDF